jgi:hypothetical protein
MLAKRGGYAVQQRSLLTGKYPTAVATRVRLLKRQQAKTKVTADSPKQREPSVFFKLPIGF